MRSQGSTPFTFTRAALCGTRLANLTTCAGSTADLWELSSGRYDLLLLLNRLVLRLQVSGVDPLNFAQHIRHVERRDIWVPPIVGSLRAFPLLC